KDGQLKWIIENGINPSGMPAWNGILSHEEMWNIVRFLRHLPVKGSLGIPNIYKEEQEEHEHEHEHEHMHGSSIKENPHDFGKTHEVVINENTDSNKRR